MLGYRNEMMDSADLQTELWKAAAEGDQVKIRVLVGMGADVEAEDEEGRTALNIASQKGHSEAYRTLLAARELKTFMKADVLNPAQQRAKADEIMRRTGSGR